METMVQNILAQHKEWDEATLKQAYADLGELVLSPEVAEFPYEVRNKPFVTAHKLMAFDRCEYCYHKKYVEMVQDVTTEGKEYFIIGQAVDDYLTLGEEAFSQKYIVMDRRISDVEEAIAEQESKIIGAQKEFLKDGVTRSATSLKDEQKAKERITFLRSISNKTQLTPDMLETVKNAVREFKSQTTFNLNPKKHVFFHVWEGFLLKAELDDYEADINRVNDVKTVASIMNCTGNWADSYIPQAGFYEWLVEENVGQAPEVTLEIVDKYDYFSRSVNIRYRHDTLLPSRGKMISTLAKMRMAHDTGYFQSASDNEILFACPYYGVEGHGRPTQPIYY